MTDYQPGYANSYALIIGIDAYQSLPPLSAAATGAQDLATILRDRYAFDATLLKDAQAKRDTIFGWLANVRRKVTPNDRVLIYFAGHGLTRGTGVHERGFLALADTILDEWHTALPMDEVTEEARYLTSKHLLYILDCCFGGLALEGRAVPDIPRELSYYLTRQVRYAISAGGREVVDDSLAPDGKHSLFTYHLLDWLDTEGYVPPSGIWRARDLGNYLEQMVARDRRSGHKPNHNYLPGSEDGDFVFDWEIGVRFAPDLEMALRSESFYVRWGGVGQLIEITRGDDEQLADLARERLQIMANDDPDLRVQQAAQGFFIEEEALAQQEAQRLSQIEAERQASDAQHKREEAKRMLLEADEAEHRAEIGRQQTEEAEQARQKVLESVHKAREITTQSGKMRLSSVSEAVAEPKSPVIPTKAQQSIISEQVRPIIGNSIRHGRLPKWVWVIGGITGLGVVVAGLVLSGVLDAGISHNADWIPSTKEFESVWMAKVPPGCFQMGNEHGNLAEQPVHRVCFNQPFWIDVYEVTYEQYYPTSETYSGDKRARVNILWEEAESFCERRGARLPTEAEWEYAARGPDGLMYPWGNSFVADNAVYRGNSVEAKAVGSAPGGVSWVGALDLSGNVSEWVADSFSADYYGTLEEGIIDPKGPTLRDLDYKVFRGGSVASIMAYELRTNTRFRLISTSKSYDIGFRCARSD